MESIKGEAYENRTYYERTKRGDLTKVEEFGDEVGEVVFTVESVFDLNREDKILPAEVIDGANEYPQLFRYLSFVVGSAITNPKDYDGVAVRAYKTKDHSEALLLAALVSGWLGGAYIVVAPPTPTYYAWSRGRRHYLVQAEQRDNKWPWTMPWEIMKAIRPK